MVLIAISELDAKLFTLGFDTVTYRQIVGIVDLQLLLVAIERKNMMLIDDADLCSMG